MTTVIKKTRSEKANEKELEYLRFEFKKECELIRHFYPVWPDSRYMPQAAMEPADVARIMNITRRAARQFIRESTNITDDELLCIPVKMFCKRTGADKLTIILCLAYLHSSDFTQRAIKS
jgi:hypothetical protein